MSATKTRSVIPFPTVATRPPRQPAKPMTRFLDAIAGVREASAALTGSSNPHERLMGRKAIVIVGILMEPIEGELPALVPDLIDHLDDVNDGLIDLNKAMSLQRKLQRIAEQNPCGT